MSHLRHSALLTLALGAACVGCASRPAGPFTAAGGESLATVRHIVLIDLKDPADIPALVTDMDNGIAKIPGIVHFWRGEPVRTGRPEVKGDYDLGLIIDFRDSAAYEAYTTDERHVTLVRSWKPKLQSLTIYDVGPAAIAR